MSTKFWAPNAAAIAQVNTITVGGTIANGQVYTVTINSKAVSYTASVGTDTNTSVASSLTTLLQASAYPEFQEVTWANPSNGVITGTAFTAGVPFTSSSSATGTGTLVTSTTTANSGPSDVSLAANWNGGLPVNGDDVTIRGTSTGLLYNLSALSAVALNSLTIESTFTGQIGLPVYNTSGYTEYRPTFWQISATTETYLAGSGQGSQRIQRDQGAAAWTVIVNKTGSPVNAGEPALWLKGTNVANVLNVTQGNVGVAFLPGSLATFATINIGYQRSQTTDVTLWLGSGCTLTTINQDGGTLYVNSGVTTLTQRAGTSTVYDGAAVTTLDVEAGTCYFQSTGTIGTGTVGSGGTLDFSKDARARTVTNCTCYGTLNDPNHTVTFTNPVFFPTGLGNNGATLNYGTNFHLARS